MHSSIHKCNVGELHTRKLVQQNKIEATFHSSNLERTHTTIIAQCSKSSCIAWHLPLLHSVALYLTLLLQLTSTIKSYFLLPKNENMRDKIIMDENSTSKRAQQLEVTCSSLTIYSDI